MRSTARSDDEGKDLRTLVEDYQRRLILSALAACGGQKNRAAAQLGLLPTTLHEKIKRLGIGSTEAETAPPGAQAVVLGQRREEFRWRGRLPAGAVLEIKGMSGGVRAAAAEGEEVEVMAVRSGRSTDGQVAVSVLEHEHGAMFSVYETRAGQARPGAGGGRLRVDFEVRVPPGVALVARILSGNIEITGLTGRVEAYTMSGQVRLRSPAPAWLPEAEHADPVRGRPEAPVPMYEALA